MTKSTEAPNKGAEIHCRACDAVWRHAGDFDEHPVDRCAFCGSEDIHARVLR